MELPPYKMPSLKSSSCILWNAQHIPEAPPISSACHCYVSRNVSKNRKCFSIPKLWTEALPSSRTFYRTRHQAAWFVWKVGLIIGSSCSVKSLSVRWEQSTTSRCKAGERIMSLQTTFKRIPSATGLPLLRHLLPLFNGVLRTAMQVCPPPIMRRETNGWKWRYFKSAIYGSRVCRNVYRLPSGHFIIGVNYGDWQQIVSLSIVR